MRRRDFIHSGALAAIGGLTASCGAAHRTMKDPAALRPAARRTFARVKAAPDRVIRTVVGLRPFRPSGFVVRGDKLDRKIVIHNYGHGGGGLTLSWGTAHLAVDEALKTGQSRFAVLGSGANGLATARLLQQRGFDVTIYTRDLPMSQIVTPGANVTQAITSNIAAGQWSPATVFVRSQTTPQFMDQFNRALKLAFHYYQDLAGPRYGIRWIENYSLSDRAPQQRRASEVEALLPEVRDLSPEEHSFGAPYVHRFTTMLIEPPVYLPAVLRDFRIAGGKVIVREFHDLGEVLSLPEPVVMNCTGIGAGTLFKDDQLTPVKGQLTFLLPQPEVDYIYLSGELYMFPRSDGILLGGTHEPGVWSLDPNVEAAQRIMQGHMKVISEMRS